MLILKCCYKKGSQYTALSKPGEKSYSDNLSQLLLDKSHKFEVVTRIQA